MSASAAALVHTWQVGRYEVTLTVPPLRRGRIVEASVEWSPDLPHRPLTAKEASAYQRGLAAALSKLGQPAPVET